LEEEKKPTNQNQEKEEETKPDQPEIEENFEALIEESFQHRHIEEGEIISGTVVSVGKDYVMVDIGDKCEGQVPVDEFKDAEGEIKINPGDEIEVLVEKKQEDLGIIILSKSKAEKKRLWEQIDQAYREETPIEGKIVERVKGGYMVDIGGVRAFMPGSQADIRPIKNPDSLIGKSDRFQVLKFNRKRVNVVVSRRAVLEKEWRRMRERTLSELEEGVVVKGKVKNITDYGAFIDIGGVDGLLHITDMSWRKITHPSEILSVGDEIEVKVLKFDREKERVSLGLKQLEPDPWENVDKKYPIGTIVQGKVVNITEYGAFIELEPGVEGLVHVSEMSWSKKRISPREIVKLGEIVEAKVLDIDLQNRKISLGMKQVMPNPWQVLQEKYPPGTKVRGKVKNMTNFGVFVDIGQGIDGLIHISDLSWVKKIRHPKELLKKGDEVECVVLEIDPEQERFSLGIKQLQPDPWSLVPEKYRPGSRVKGKVVSITDFGAFVQLEEGIEGLVHISEMSDEPVKTPEEVVKVGEEVLVEVLSVDPNERRIRLSLRTFAPEEETAYQPGERDGTSKLGEIIQKKLAEAKGKELFTQEKEKEESSASEAEKESSSNQEKKE